MPERNWANCLIYVIRCKDETITDCYVGSTCNFARRKCQHKCSANAYHHLLLYTIINAHGGWDNWTMEKLEDYPCASQKEALDRERHWYNELKATLNVQKPSTTKEEKLELMKSWRKANPERFAAAIKKWQQANPDKMREYSKRYRDKHPELYNAAKTKWIEANKEKHLEASNGYAKKYYQAHREERLAYAKAYREKKLAEQEAQDTFSVGESPADLV